MDTNNLQRRIQELELELSQLKAELNDQGELPRTVIVPEHFSPLFAETEPIMREYFSDFKSNPESGEITAHGERYLLFRSDSLSYEFLDFIKQRYSDRPEEEAISIGNNFLFDNAKVTGKRDALAFHKKMKLEDPLAKLSAGPIHFAFTGWANVEILDDSVPSPDSNYFLHFKHHNSWEAQSWIKAGRTSETTVCTMNCGYSAGWCEESFDLSLTTVEVKCEARGDDACEFIMAPTDKIEELISREVEISNADSIDIPVFFKRQCIEAELLESVKQKELIIQEIHHRVKNNLQVISSLLRLQMENIHDKQLQQEFQATIDRANTIATVHELMYQRNEFREVGMDIYMKELTHSLIQLYGIEQKANVSIDINVSDVQVSLDKSIPLALILNEIICNSFKYGLKEGGHFELSLNETGKNAYCLVAGDDGPGMTEGENGLGMELIDMLIEQIDAHKTVYNSSEGLRYSICFSLED
ncbi:MAG: histidine kinase dimerization/phosphoacceptor domain -containing protein [Crocinitomicaceae bacterium]|nr:histidine kinase dimerization/phosphoacceptor domain -containing protein [Crocinitomicaceae bacterium]